LEPAWELNGITGFKVKQSSGDYEAVIFYKKNIRLLELRITGTAIAVLGKKHIHEWLWKTGIEYINKKKIDKPIVLTIQSTDVLNGELVPNWEE